jgi:thiamine monophosphate kinase
LHDSDIDITVIGKVKEGNRADLVVGGTAETMGNEGYEHFTKG